VKQLQNMMDSSAQAIFHVQWQTYRRIVDRNYFFHREVYARLNQILHEEAALPFQFLDIACGDAGSSVAALVGTRIAHYHGIDQSAAALALAREALTALPCPVTLEQRDFIEALNDDPSPMDVAWIGLSLHHLHTPEKLEVMRDIRDSLNEGGLLLIYEPTSPEGEAREEWLRRWDSQRPSWTGYTADEWAAVSAHVHAADFPETISGWHELGTDAGFSSVDEVFAAPTNLFRMFCFRA
jgi:SAM-dependent methyltransferase